MVTSMKKLFAAVVAAGMLTGGAWAAGAVHLLSDLIAANGSYLDSSGNGTNWSVSSAPGFNSSAFNNQPAWVFDGSTSTPLIAAQNYFGGTPFNFTPPIGDWAAVAVVDLNTSSSTSNNTLYTILGTTLTGANQWAFGQYNRTLYWGGAGCDGQKNWTGTAVYNGATTLLTTTPHVIGFSYSNTDQTVSVCVDSCAAGWQAYSIAGQTSGTPSSASTDGTLWAGASRATTVCGSTPEPWYGNYYEIRLYRESLSTAGIATYWAQQRDLLRSKYGTP